MGDRPVPAQVLCPAGGPSEPALKGAYSTCVIRSLCPLEMARWAEGRLRGLHSRWSWRLLREKGPELRSGWRTTPRAHQGAGVCAGNGFLPPSALTAPVTALTAGPRGQHASVCFPAQRPASGPGGFQEGTPSVSQARGTLDLAGLRRGLGACGPDGLARWPGSKQGPPNIRARVVPPAGELLLRWVQWGRTHAPLRLTGRARGSRLAKDRGSERPPPRS